MQKALWLDAIVWKESLFETVRLNAGELLYGKTEQACTDATSRANLEGKRDIAHGT
jgi:hypothetical protein